MYKELVISLIIVVLIFTLDFVTQKYTDRAINETIENLSSIEEKIKEDDVDNKKVLEEAEDKYQKWLDHHKRLAFYIEHDELEKVETNFVSGKSFIQNAKYEDATSDLEKTIFVLNHINDKYSINLENIF